MKILFFGDVVGQPGRQAVTETIPKWRDEHKPDLIIANAENSAGGAGASPATLTWLQQAGVDTFTFGDHYFDKDFSLLVDYPIVRPANFVGDLVGVGARIVETALHQRVLIMNLAGHAFMRYKTENFFNAVDKLLGEFKDEQADAIFVDFHAEATSEKLAMGYHLDGRVSAVVGTHTHVPTADARILPNGTAFQADAGMCGYLNSVLGMSIESSSRWLRSEMGEDVPRSRRKVDAEPPFICDAVLIDVAGPTKSTSITRLTTRP